MGRYPESAEDRAQHVRDEYERQWSGPDINWNLLHVLIRRECYQACDHAEAAAYERGAREMQVRAFTALDRLGEPMEEASDIVFALPLTPEPAEEEKS